MFTILKPQMKKAQKNQELNLYKWTVSKRIFSARDSYLVLLTACHLYIDTRENTKRFIENELYLKGIKIEEYEIEELIIEAEVLTRDNLDVIMGEVVANRQLAEEYITQLIDLYFNKKSPRLKELIYHFANLFILDDKKFKRMWAFVEAYYTDSNDLNKLAKEVSESGPKQLLPIYTTAKSTFSYEYTESDQTILCNVPESHILRYLANIDWDIDEVFLVNCKINFDKLKLTFEDLSVVKLIHCDFYVEKSPDVEIENDEWSDDFDFGEEYGIQTSSVTLVQLQACTFKNINIPVLQIYSEKTIIENCHFENIRINGTTPIIFQSYTVTIHNNIFKNIVVDYINAEPEDIGISCFLFDSDILNVEIRNNLFKKCHVGKGKLTTCVCYINWSGEWDNEQQINNNKISGCDKTFLMDRSYNIR